jgi:hypothetical protein
MLQYVVTVRPWFGKGPTHAVTKHDWLGGGIGIGLGS